MDVTYFNQLMVGITLSALCLALVALVATFIWYSVRQSTRLSDLENRQQQLQSGIVQQIQEILSQVPPSSNPGLEVVRRRDELLYKMRANTIARAEAMELNDILIRERNEARERGDTATLVAVILGLALLAAILAGK